MTTRKRIAIISAVYPPEPVVSARMSYDLANHLAAHDFLVTVICPQPSRPATADYGNYRNPRSPIERTEGTVQVVRLPSFAAPESRLLPRMRENLSFGWEAAKYLSCMKQTPDVIYVNTWPLFAQAIMARFAKKKKVPMVLQIMDIYPEALVGKLPFLLRSLICAPLRRLDASAVKSAAAIVVISDNMARTYIEDRGIPSERSITIPTWQDEAAFVDLPQRLESCSRYDVSADLFTFLFLGNIGPVAGVQFLIQAFAEAAIADAQLLIIGDGAAKIDSVNLARRLRLSNVHFISDHEVRNVPSLQSMAHVCMLPMRRNAGTSSIPSKLASYLLSAKPVIATVDMESDTARFIRQAECGWVCAAEDLPSLIETMQEVTRMSAEELDAIGQRGREFALENFSKSRGVIRLADTITRVAGLSAC